MNSVFRQWRRFTQRCADAETVLIAAPYIKEPPLRELLDRIEAPRLRCVSSWTPFEIRLGSSDLGCRALILEAGGQFMLHPSLHAKYYRADEFVLIGSANLTASGLGLAASPNLEILCEPGGAFDWQDFESQLLGESREITDEEFNLWEQYAHDEALTFSTPPNLDDWHPQTRNPEYVWLAYSGGIDDIPMPSQRVLAIQDLLAIRPPRNLRRDGLSHWLSESLLASPFAEFVDELSNRLEDETVIWKTVADEWDLSMADAQRLVSTAQIWIRWSNNLI